MGLKDHHFGARSALIQNMTKITILLLPFLPTTGRRKKGHHGTNMKHIFCSHQK